jgi:hypothetical protein
MGGRAGGGASGGMGKGSRSASARANQLANHYLGGVNNPALKKELSSALADYEKEFGLPAGLTITMGGTDALGKINGLNQMHLNSEYESGKRTPAEARKTFIHELTHGIDKTDTHRTGNISGIATKGASVKGVLKTENKGFDKKLTSAYKHFKSHYGSSDTKAIGRYALKSKHEFFAEALSSHMTGTQNKYTTFAYNLAKSMSGK